MEKVMTFNCEVRHGGDLMHSTPKYGVTQREMRILRAIHGEDAVVNIKEAGEQDINQRDEAFELAVRYSKTSNPRHGKTLVERVLNISLDGFDKWFEERRELQEMELKERLEKSQREAVRFNAAREAAEAQVRSDMARERALAPAA